MIDLVSFAKANYPAKHYMLLLTGHGSGWVDFSPQPERRKGISFNGETNNHIRTTQLHDILQAVGYIDVLYLHACLMQMAEVVHEVKDNLGVLVASEETMSDLGFDYDASAILYSK